MTWEKDEIREQRDKIKALEAKVKLLQKENKELKEKMAVSSIKFDLPKDYYENDEYLV